MSYSVATDFYERVACLCSPLTCRGRALETHPEALGELEPLPNAEAPRQQLIAHYEEHQYLYIPGFLDRDEVFEVRRALTAIMAKRGLLAAGTNPLKAIPAPAISELDQSKGSVSADEIARDCKAMRDLIYGERVMSFFERFLGGAPRHFDYTWLRTVAPGLATVPHCDIVYMGRGTHQLFTMWTPYGDVPMETGGLMILEDSLNKERRLRRYLERDVDTYCSNRPPPEHVNFDSQTDNKVWNGWLARNPVTLRRNLGGRWLTTDYRAGDVLVFPVKLVHAGIDNRSGGFRLSSDSRYQLASEPADERFVGPGPYGHTGAAKRARVC